MLFWLSWYQQGPPRFIIRDSIGARGRLRGVYYGDWVQWWWRRREWGRERNKKFGKEGVKTKGSEKRKLKQRCSLTVWSLKHSSEIHNIINLKVITFLIDFLVRGPHPQSKGFLSEYSGTYIRYNGKIKQSAECSTRQVCT